MKIRVFIHRWNPSTYQLTLYACLRLALLECTKFNAQVEVYSDTAIVDYSSSYECFDVT